jgi:hydrogenase maturation protein HypF
MAIITRRIIQVEGIVQGVGFRPFVYLLAHERSLCGRVLNNSAGVLIEVEGEQKAIDQFLNELISRAPSLARIESLRCSDNLEPAQHTEFRIVESEGEGRKFVPVSPDVATCSDCLRELFDPNNRRYRYPFINCTNCGPRFTIIEDVPYDRAKTTMRLFAMCDACRAEYENPLDRRFHAEPTACANCGPHVYLVGPNPRAGVSATQPLVSGRGERSRLDPDNDPIHETLALIASGKILAIKGIGGFHLACDAQNAEAVAALRRRKYREDKPFALMARSVEIIRKYCSVTVPEEQLLLSAARPIVLLARKAGAAIPEAVAPRVNTLGFMLPYAPLHHLLFEHWDGPLVMTSANISDEPICYEDEDARRRLVGIADYYLLHNRPIHMRTDDSVARVAETQVLDSKDAATSTSRRDAVHPDLPSPLTGRPMVLRRSRGYAPEPLRTGFEFRREILACGAELKNTFCLTRGDYAFVSHHIGDLENFETLQSFREGIEHFKRLFYLEPDVVAYDLHPEYLSTKYALALDQIETKFGIQHHHAHIASCMADNQSAGEVIGVAMDGLGFGTDGRMWGGEFFVANYAEAERIAHLDYLAMPGGAKAIREPWRMAAAYLYQTFGDEFEDLTLPFAADLDTRAWATLKRMITTRTNCPETSSMGRLFDAVSSLLRLRDATNYEGQAAIELEQIADRDCGQRYDFEVSAAEGIVRAQPVIRGAVEDLLSQVPPAVIAAKFHLGVADLIVRMAVTIREQRKLNRVALSGGVFQNVMLLQAACKRLSDASFEVLTHCRVPPNDGGISLGQAAIANALLRREL